MPFFRSLFRQPGYLALSLTTLTLAVGANLVVFTVVNAIWLKPRPVRDPDRVVMVMADTGSLGSNERFFFAERGLQLQVREVAAFESVAGQVMTSGVYQSLAPHHVGEQSGIPSKRSASHRNTLVCLGCTSAGATSHVTTTASRRAPKAVVPDQHFWLERLHRKEWNQSNEGANPERRARVVRQVQDVIEESVLIVPEVVAAATLSMTSAHRVRDAQEMLPELARHVFVRRIVLRQLHRDGQHVQGVHGHPARTVGLFEMSACRQRSAPVEHANVVETEESPLEDVHPLGVLPVDPPGEVQKELVEHALEELHVAGATALRSIL